MSDVVRLRVPPFAPAAPTSLAALTRPLIQPEQTRCEAHCQPCESCVAEQVAQVKAARKTASDLGLRLSQLVEDAMAQHMARIEAQQSELVSTVLGAVLPYLAQDTVRRTVHSELTASLADPLRTETLRLSKSPDLDLGVIPQTDRLSVTNDAALPIDQIMLTQGDAQTEIDASALVQHCLSLLGVEPATSSSSISATDEPAP